MRHVHKFIARLSVAVLSAGFAVAAGAAGNDRHELHDSHFHLTNYVQEGTDIRDFLGIMGDRVGRVAIFGIPLQQMWSYENSQDFAPTYYLQSDAPLYYYSFTDAWIATAYKSLDKSQQARFDPMITGFNPADMYAADHIRRVLRTFPGVFSGIGEFTIHKEFVSAKVAGGEPSLANRALDRIFEFAGQAGLVVLIHNDVDMPFAGQGATPVYLQQMRDLLLRHPDTTVIWAHVGLGRVVHPVQSEAGAAGTERPANQVGIVERILSEPRLQHLHFDLSWSEVAKYIVATPQSLERAAYVINRFPDRFLFGTDEVAPKDQATYLRVYRQYDPLWQLLTPEARQKVLKGNYERLFDAARVKVRQWEAANLK
jgi:predicted TIM-barrel fold metal-dependent hydrolase